MRGTCARESEWEKCDCDVVKKKKYSAVENPFYVLIVSEGDVLVAQNVHCRVYKKLKVKNELKDDRQKLNGG